MDISNIKLKNKHKDKQLSLYKIHKMLFKDKLLNSI